MNQLLVYGMDILKSPNIIDFCILLVAINSLNQFVKFLESSYNGSSKVYFFEEKHQFFFSNWFTKMEAMSTDLKIFLNLNQSLNQ